MTITVLNTKISGAGNKIPDNYKYITTKKFNKLAAGTLVARLKQADFKNKTTFDNKLTSFKKRITSNKTKYLEVKKKLNSLITKDYVFFLGRIYFKSNDGFELKAIDVLELKNDKGTDHVLSWNQREYLVLNLSHYILLHCIA